MEPQLFPQLLHLTLLSPFHSPTLPIIFHHSLKLTLPLHFIPVVFTSTSGRISLLLESHSFCLLLESNSFFVYMTFPVHLVLPPNFPQFYTTETGERLKFPTFLLVLTLPALAFAPNLVQRTYNVTHHMVALCEVHLRAIGFSLNI
jgi:hypothetical protein